MAEKLIGRDYNFKGTSKVTEAIINPYADLTALTAASTAGYYGTEQEGILAYVYDINEFRFWDGSSWEPLTPQQLSGNEEIELITGAAPPIDTDVKGLVVTGTTPTLSSTDVKELVWKDNKGYWHIYYVESHSPLTITEMTRNLFITISGSWKKTSDIQALPPRFNTLYKSALGHLWLSDESGTVTRIGYKRVFSEVVWTQTSLTAGVSQTFRLDGNNLGNKITIGDDDLKTNPAGGPAAWSRYTSSANALVSGITILDASNNNSVDTESYEIVPISNGSFTVESNVAADIIVVYTGHLTVN